jgi:hypothetical protein
MFTAVNDTRIVVAPIHCTVHTLRILTTHKIFYTLYGKCMVKTNYEKS